MAGGLDLEGLGTPRTTGIGRSLIQQILRDTLNPQQPTTSSILGRDIDLNTINPEQAAALTSELKDAKSNTGFNGVQEAFDILDIPGAFVRGVVGAGVSAAKGEFGTAGERLLSAIPGSENLPKLFGKEGYRAPEGSDLLADFGWEKGTTAEDERRLRIAQAAGMGRAEALRKFATGEPLDFETQVQFDTLAQKAQKNRPNLELGVTFEDSKKAADAQDVAGFAVEIALDPLTYFTLGASAAGKSARAISVAEKAGAKGLMGAVKGAETFADAARAIKLLDTPGFGPKAKSRLLGHLEEAFKGAKPNLELGRTLAEQAQRGQRSAGFKLPFGPRFGPELSTEKLDSALSVLGQSRLSESVFGEVVPGVNKSVHDFMTEVPVVAQVTKTIRGVLEGGRKLAGRTGIAELDDIIKQGKELGMEGAAGAGRELNKLNEAMRQTAKTAGVSLDDVRASVAKAVEIGDKDAAELAATLTRTGLKQSGIAPIAAGFTKINDMLADAAEKWKLPFNRLEDDSLSYMHRMLTDPGREWVRKNSKKLKDVSGGAEFSARSGIFKGRIEKWRGKTIKEINEEMSEVMDGAKFFTEDPFAATTHAVGEMHRRIGNAYTATNIVERFGVPAVEGGEFTAAKLYEKVGLKVADDEIEALSKVAVPEDIFNAVENAVAIQKSPGKFLRGYHRVTNWMKATVTTLFPAFHGRNMLENYGKALFEGGGKLGDYQDATKILAAAQDLNAGGAGFFDSMARAARRTFAKVGAPDDELMRLLKDETGFDNLDDFAAWASGGGLFENKFTSEFGIDMRRALLGKEPTSAQKAATGFGELLGAPQRAGFAVASGTENLHRLAFFLDRLKKGYGRQGALEEVKRVFFDYRDLGNAESALAKNFGFFYNFYRNNMRYITQTAMKHPVMSKQIMRLFFDDPDNPRHSWLSSKGTFSVGGVDVALGFLPQQQFNMFSLAEGDIFDKAYGKLAQGVGQLNPLIEQGLSGAFQKDLYRNLPLEYVDRAPDWSHAPEWVKSMIGLRETVSGGYVMSPKWRWMMDTIPALGRFAQSQISTESDRAYWQTLAQMTTGLRFQNREPTKDALERLRRNIDRTAADMDDVRQGAFGEWVTDRRTKEGRLKSALTKQSPNGEDLIFLASEPEIMARLAPYVTMNAEGEPVMNRLLRDKMLALGTELYPRHMALMQAQQAQRAAQVRALSPAEQQAQSAFGAMFGGQ